MVAPHRWPFRVLLLALVGIAGWVVRPFLPSVAVLRDPLVVSGLVLGAGRLGLVGVAVAGWAQRAAVRPERPITGCASA